MPKTISRENGNSKFRIERGTKLSDLEIDIGTVERVPESIARKHNCMPIHAEEDKLHIATANASNLLLKDQLRFILNRDVDFHFFPKSQVRVAINKHYGPIEGESADSILQEFTDAAIDFTELHDCESGNSNLCSSSVVHRKRKVSAGTFGCAAPTQRTLQSIQKSGAGMFFYTIRDGQKALAYRKTGRIDLIEGPSRVWRGSNEFKLLNRFVAHPGQYLAIRFLDGTQQNIKGPAEVWQDPRIHQDISVEGGLELAGKEAVVVYGGEKNGITQRRIVHGPTKFVPEPDEWLHQFSWHASREGSKGVEKQPNGLQFHKLWMMPDQMYHDVRDVRTADDAVLIIRLMIFFELVDIEKMLDTTHDPIGDFINAATSDVVEFTGKRSFDTFKKQTEHLNDLSTYSQLMHRAKQCGYQINNVVYRGYGAPDSLQKMHDEAIAARTSLQLNTETERQTQELEDYRLQCQMERSQRRREEQATEVEHDLQMQEQRDLAKFASKRRQIEFDRQQTKLDADLQLEFQQQKDRLQEEHLGSLQGMNVRLTEYLTQGRADQVIELRGGNKNTPHIHLSQNGKATANGQKAK